MRLADDYEGPAQLIALADGKVQAQSVRTSSSKWEQQQLDRVRWGTGCEDVDRISSALDSANGSTDTVGFLSPHRDPVFETPQRLALRGITLWHVHILRKVNCITDILVVKARYAYPSFDVWSEARINCILIRSSFIH